ncbi:MAG TPA: hypothetical protein DDW30_04875 [Clostridiales bacterium]|nr:hypothetical protein [Clostridiales bacterium]
MRERNHIVRVHLNDREPAHLEKCLSKTQWGKEAFLRAAIQGTGIASKPPEDCQEIIDRLREIGDCLNVLPLQVAKLSTEEKEALGKATREIWRLYGLVQDVFLPPYRYHMRTVILPKIYSTLWMREGSHSARQWNCLTSMNRNRQIFLRS